MIYEDLVKVGKKEGLNSLEIVSVCARERERERERV